MWLTSTAPANRGPPFLLKEMDHICEMLPSRPFDVPWHQKFNFLLTNFMHNATNKSSRYSKKWPILQSSKFVAKCQIVTASFFLTEIDCRMKVSFFLICPRNLLKTYMYVSLSIRKFPTSFYHQTSHHNSIPHFWNPWLRPNMFLNRLLCCSCYK